MSQSRYEILKIWIPTHGVVNIYRRPSGGEWVFGKVLEKQRDPFSDSNLTSIVFLFTEYHADNAVILEAPIKQYGVEKLRILASQGGVIKITRDDRESLHNKYTIEPSLSMDQSEVYVDDRAY